MTTSALIGGGSAAGGRLDHRRQIEWHIADVEHAAQTYDFAWNADVLGKPAIVAISQAMLLQT